MQKCNQTVLALTLFGVVWCGVANEVFVQEQGQDQGRCDPASSWRIIAVLLNSYLDRNISNMLD